MVSVVFRCVLTKSWFYIQGTRRSHLFKIIHGCAFGHILKLCVLFYQSVEWIEFEGSEYFLSDNDRVERDAAHACCQEVGANLATITSAAENTFLYSQYVFLFTHIVYEAEGHRFRLSLLEIKMATLARSRS